MKFIFPLAMLISVSSFAGVAVDTAEALKIASQTFEKNHANELVNYTGAKAWPDQGTTQVKIYLTNNRSLQFSCHIMDGSLMCHEQ